MEETTAQVTTKPEAVHRQSYQREFRFLLDSGLPGDCPLILEIGDISDITLQLKSTELNGEKLLGGKLRLAR